MIIGQPNVAERRLDNPVVIPWVLSFLAYGTFHADVQGLDAFPPDVWPDNIELLYYAFHIMAGLGTILTAIALFAVLLAWLGRLETNRPMLWIIMLAFPLPYIANTVGWMTAELGRQPWLVYGLFRTAQGSSPTVHSGTVLFTLMGFCGLYLALGLLFLFLIGREIAHGPGPLAPVARAGVRGRAMFELWFAIAALMFAIYVALDGFDLGAGILSPFVARTDSERRQVLAAIGPYWDGNEVWLLAGGGVLFLAFPRVLSSGISGFYFAIVLLLWCLLGRGIAIEFRSHVTDSLWRSAWDFVFAAASTLLAVFLGAAFGNLMRGVPLDRDGWFALPLFTNFSAREPVGILDWYTILTGRLRPAGARRPRGAVPGVEDRRRRCTSAAVGWRSGSGSRWRCSGPS